MTRDIVTRTDGTTVDVQKAEAESYDTNAKILRFAGLSDTYVQRIDYTAGGLPLYIGFAVPGSASSAAVWQIKKITYSGSNITVVEFADGDTKFDNIWDNRTSLSYS
jgi:hypothetical protein